jgi:hypothetical protein
MPEIKRYLEDIVLADGGPVWTRFFERLGTYLDKRFGPDWKERDTYFKEFEASLQGGEPGEPADKDV